MEKKNGSREGNAAESASHLIDARIEELADWRGKTLAHVRKLIHQADPDVVEEWKWRGVPVWSHAGILCTGETYKSAVKLTFAKGASLDDPSGLFNSSLDGNTRRATDPTAKQLLNKYKVPMPNQNLSDAEIRGYLKYFRFNDSAAPKPQAKK